MIFIHQEFFFLSLLAWMLWCSFLLGVTAARLRLVVFQLFFTDLSCLIYSELSADCCALQRVPRVFPCEPISIYTLLFVDIAKISWTAFCWVFVSVSSLRVFTGSAATSCHTINTTPFTKHCDMTQTSPTKSQVTLGPHCSNPWPRGVIMCSLDDATSAYYSLCRWQPMVCCLLLVWHGDVDDAVDRISNEQPIFSPVVQNLLQGTSSCLKAEVLAKQCRCRRYQHWHWQLL